MSLLPFLLNELIDDYRRPNRDIYAQHFGLGMLEGDLPITQLMALPLRCGYRRPWRNDSVHVSGLSSITSDENDFKVNLDVQQFKPEELKVRVEGEFIVVDGKHEEKTDQHGIISRQFTRKYKIPDDVDIKAIISNLSSDGILSLKAPKKISTENPSRDSNQPYKCAGGETKHQRKK